MLFEAEDSDDVDDLHQHFAIDDDDENTDLDDFADFDDGETLTNTKKYKKKD
jgi:hypothetical protein